MGFADNSSFAGEHAVGLDINYDRMVAAHFVRGGRGLTLAQLAVQEFDPGCSDRELSLQLKAFWERNRLPVHTVCCCLHTPSKIVRYFRYNNVTEDELPQVLLLEAEEALQLPREEISMDWLADGGEPAAGGKESVLSGIMVAVPRQEVRRHIGLLRTGGVYPVRIEVSCSVLMALSRFLQPGAAEAAHCMINLSERTADLVVMSGGRGYPRTLFSVKERWSDNTAYLLDNIKDALLHYHLKVRQSPVQTIFLTGRMSGMPELADSLAGATSMQVSVLDLATDPRMARAVGKIPDSVLKNSNIAMGVGLGLLMPK